MDVCDSTCVQTELCGMIYGLLCGALSERIVKMHLAVKHCDYNICIRIFVKFPSVLELISSYEHL